MKCNLSVFSRLGDLNKKKFQFMSLSHLLIDQCSEIFFPIKILEGRKNLKSLANSKIVAKVQSLNAEKNILES
jgi:hypothetical protein